jgi:molybdopterin synthase catalytic subunit
MATSSTHRNRFEMATVSTCCRRWPVARPSFFVESATKRFHSTRFEKQSSIRDHADGQRVSRLDYEAHESLAEKEMKRVLEGVVAEHTGVRIAAVHRVGTLGIGDVAVCVAASAAHRDDAFAACRKAIDRIKETVPLWKKEWGRDGDARWVNLDD